MGSYNGNDSKMSQHSTQSYVSYALHAISLPSISVSFNKIH
jgi:hypothetical protein